MKKEFIEELKESLKEKPKNENCLAQFLDIRESYDLLIDMMKSGSFSETNVENNKKYFTRIKINNCILDILNAIERIELKDFDKDELNLIDKIFGEKNFDINKFRNCLAHAHFDVSEDYSKITFKQDKFNYEIDEQRFEEIVANFYELINSKLSNKQLEMDGINLNRFIDDIISGKDTISTSEKTYATILRSLNIYQAFIYEKTMQVYEKNNFVQYYKQKSILNSNLPYINNFGGNTTDTLSEYSTFQFSKLREDSKKEIIELLLTSEYKDDAINFFNENDVDAILKRIDNKEIEENAISNFMISRFARMGRIENNDIMPMKKDLLYGFNYKPEETDSSMIIYPSIDEVLEIIETKEEKIKYFSDYIESNKIKKFINEINISEDKIIKKPDLLFYLLNNRDLYNIPENLKGILSKLEEVKNNSDSNVKSGKIYRDAMIEYGEENWNRDVDLNSIYEINENLKKDFIMNRIHEYIFNDDPISAYRNLLYLYSSKLNDKSCSEIKHDIEHGFITNEKYKDNEMVNKLLQVGGLFDLKDKLLSQDGFIDYTKLLAHLRDASIHAYVEVDYGEEFYKYRKITIKKDNYHDLDDENNLDFISKLNQLKRNKKDCNNFGNIKFNFQDYDQSIGETTFLMTNIPSENFIDLINIQSEDILEIINGILKSKYSLKYKSINKNRISPNDEGNIKE